MDSTFPVVRTPHLSESRRHTRPMKDSIVFPSAGRAGKAVSGASRGSGAQPRPGRCRVGGELVGLSVAAIVSGNHAVSGVHPAGSRQVRDLSIWDFGVAPCFAGRGAR